MTSDRPIDRPLGQHSGLDPALGPPLGMTEEEFVAWCDEDTRAEWVDGVVVIMSPADFAHNELRGSLVLVFRGYAERHGLGRAAAGTQVRLGEQRRRRTPDILLVGNERLDRIRKTHVDGAPDLIVEIVSPESESRDWREKYHEYEEAGVREYWVIDPNSEHVEAYALVQPEGNQAEPRPRYERLREEQAAIASRVLDGLRLPTTWLWKDTRPTLIEALHGLGLIS